MAVGAGSHFNTELAKCRLKENLTLKAVSELTGINKVTLQNWECGKIRSVNISADKLTLLAELYGVSYNAIENMIEDAYKTAKKSEYVYNAVEKTTKKSKKSKNAETLTNNTSNIQSDESQSESEVITINVKNKSLTKSKKESKNKISSTINTSEAIKLEILELAYGEVTFNEFIAMTKALL